MSSRRSGGFSLVELVLGLVVFAAISASFYAVLVQIGARSADPVIQTQAIYIARAYLDEALLRNPAGASEACGLPRDQWQNIATYGACIVNQPPTDGQGTPLAALGDYAVSVSVEGAVLGGQALTRVDVAVTHANAPINLQLTGYRGN